MRNQEKMPDWLAAFEFVGGLPCLDFANTRAGPEPEQPDEVLLSYSRFLDWSVAAGVIAKPLAARLRALARSHGKQAVETLRASLAARDAFCALLESRLDEHAPASGDLKCFNEVYSRALAARRLVSSPSGFALAWHAAGSQLDAPLWPLLDSAADLLCATSLERVKRCANEARCAWFFLDASRNRSRRWCSMRSCGNHEKARRHYRRQQSAIEK